MFKSNNSYTLEEILDRVPEAKLLAFYLGITKIPCVINSPFRVDNHPSFALYSKNGKDIYYKDFSTGEKGDTINLLSKLWGYTFIETINKINKDFNKILSTNDFKQIKVTDSHSNSTITVSDLQVKVRDWKQWDIDYWESYGISLKWLKWGNVYPISHIIIKRNNENLIFPADKLAYVYVEHKDNITTLKVYQPLNKKYKWMSKHNSSIWDLWTKLPEKGDKLIITSSRKDSLAIWENTLIPAISMQAESVLPKPQIIEELKSRFKDIYVLYDNDFSSDENHGELLGQKLCTQYASLKQIEIPIEYLSKDSSDLVKNHGREVLKKVILELTN